MIDIKELRIGNRVANGKGEWEVYAIDYVGEVYIKPVNEDSFLPFDMAYAIKPIPITEDWLLRCGFKKDKYGGLTISTNTHTYMYSMKTKCLYNIDGFTASISKPFKYINQLQNLYFALTGKELEIK